MRRNQVLQLAVVQARQQPGRHAVIQMAETARNPLLQHRRIRSVAQHVRIMIAFQHQSIAATQNGFDVWRGYAGVGQHTQSPAAAAKGILHRLASVMRNGERLHLDLVCLKRTVAINQTNIGQRLREGMVGESAVSQPHRQRKPAREFDCAADMIGMFVSDEDTGKVFRL
ncbi:MAG: hypothetical protein AUK53_03295 [Betaproteobacteria bacterium CG2_30_59_46]|nr:MAG: hypothetical protein AUK53_03295 [Betaproteobacteria bacterium CG2_30_59_46]